MFISAWPWDELDRQLGQLPTPYGMLTVAHPTLPLEGGVCLQWPLHTSKSYPFSASSVEEPSEPSSNGQGIDWLTNFLMEGDT